MACETGIPHQFLEDLDGSMFNATIEYLQWRADRQVD